MLPDAASFALLAPAALAAGYYAALLAASRLPRRTPPAAEPSTRFVVLIPAHNEEDGLPATLAGVFAADYPAHLRSALVVADNCTDGTADAARRAGASVLERSHATERGKGYALAAGLPAALAAGADAVVVLDADCRLDPASLRAFDAAFRARATVAQGAVLSLVGRGSPSELVAAVGSVMESRVQAGWGRLGAPVWLRGTGMAFRREVLERHPWSAFGRAEDSEYTAGLSAAGVRVRFAEGAAVRTEAPPTEDAFLAQRRRWGAALFAGGGRRWEKLFASKPLVLAHLLATTAVILTTGGASAVAALAAVWLLTLFAYGWAVLEAGAAGALLRGGWRVPLVVGRLLAAGVRGRRAGGAWVRAARA